MAAGSIHTRCMRAAALALAATGCVTAATASGRFESRMRLGVDLPLETVRPSPKPQASAGSTCRKWRRVASRLGETFAGVSLRRSVVEKSCAFAGLDSGGETIWAWPWRGGDIADDLPPRLHVSSGDWSIRCASVGPRERCALIHVAETPLWSAETDNLRTTTHFVIDTIGGQQRVLWRVLVERAAPEWYGLAKQRTRPKSTESVQFEFSGRAHVEPFDACTGARCLMEAGVVVAAEAATQLWEGRSVTLRLSPSAELALDITLPAGGFRAGLKELGRLKGREDHAEIGR